MLSDMTTTRQRLMALRAKYVAALEDDDPVKPDYRFDGDVIRWADNRFKTALTILALTAALGECPPPPLVVSGVPAEVAPPG